MKDIEIELIGRHWLYLQGNKDGADVDGEVKDSDDHAHDQVRLQALVLSFNNTRRGGLEQVKSGDDDDDAGFKE